MLCLAFSYVKAQTILVNSNVISVQEDVTFPLWLDSMSTIEIGTQVVSISALEFNIVPTNNGNSLVFSQTKTITSQETVPNGMTWKITAVLLDSTAINNSSSSGGGQVAVSGGNMAVALSGESANTMSLGNAMIYCDSLQEGGYDNWVIPTLEKLMSVAGGGGVVPGTRTSNWLHTITPIQTSQYGGEEEYYNASLSSGNINNEVGFTSVYVRCVRHASISVSGSGSSSGGSNSTSGGGGGNMAVALSEESPSSMVRSSAMHYCDSLVEGGYDNWVVPTLDEVFFITGGGGSVPGTWSNNYFWTTTVRAGYFYIYTVRLSNMELSNSNEVDYDFVRCVRHESISVSGSGSSSGGSNTASTLGSGMPTMISNESINLICFGDAILYCDSLNESGYDDWIMPTLDQLTYASSGGCVIPDARTSNYIWT